MKAVVKKVEGDSKKAACLGLLRPSQGINITGVRLRQVRNSRRLYVAQACIIDRRATLYKGIYLICAS
jgi:hypothetical protein